MQEIQAADFELDDVFSPQDAPSTAFMDEPGHEEGVQEGAELVFVGWTYNI